MSVSNRASTVPTPPFPEVDLALHPSDVVSLLHKENHPMKYFAEYDNGQVSVFYDKSALLADLAEPKPADWPVSLTLV
jgi:hypothetical protein